MASQKVWFCSKECHKEHTRKNQLNTCPTCDEKYARRTPDQVHCSRACANKNRTGIKYDGLNKRNKVDAHVRRRAKVEATYPNECAICQLGPEWQGKPLLLQVDHIEGNNKNHEIENLRLLCPNCHTQTDTYGSRNIGKFSKLKEDII